ncbi:MAG: PAS domain S-box protein [Bacteroidota bacterium]|nr:PAS domain S-box protein [Bacteroidota bacterium]
MKNIDNKISDNYKAKKFFHGFLSGLIFPTISWIIYLTFIINKPGFLFFSIHIENILLFLINLIPFLTGYLFYKLTDKHEIKVNQLNKIIEKQKNNITRTSSFAEKIGKGELNAEFVPLGDDDNLGHSLVNMRGNLQENALMEEERNKIGKYVAEINSIVRMHNELNELSDVILAYIVRNVDSAIQGAFYIVNDENANDISIDMCASYAYNKKKYLSAKFKFGQGLVGQSAIEQDIILRTEIPYDYVTITSGLLGDRRPSCLIFVPLLLDDKVEGVLEIASFEMFTPIQIKFLQEISVILARTIYNLKINAKTLKLLEESRKMSSELQQQREQLLNNAESMRLSQVELSEMNQKLQIQIQEVNNSQKRTQVLLENASEIITIYEPRGKIRYVSPSVYSILGYSPEELTSNHDKTIYPNDFRSLLKSFIELLSTPEQTQTAQYRCIKKDGSLIWMEATGNNLILDPVIKGIVVNSRDITIRRKAEKEQRMRNQMQSLSENSPDLITRININGIIFYINPEIEKLTGYKTNEYIQKHYHEVKLPENIIKELDELFSEITSENDKKSKEIEFVTHEVEKIMLVNGIPEYGEDGKIESLLFVFHDITQSKLQENEIKEKNKNITESINYARKIQSSMLPIESDIRKILPESFMFYRPKDVISGDFPWIYQKGDNIYIAAVDCTGHGVPGTLMSFIGHFTLNQILDNEGNLEASKVLDQLHNRVQKTLRQDTNEGDSSDGMDISLCKINFRNKEIQYAGAHRPLYYLKNKELIEIKGDRYPIGGMHYKTRNDFKNNIIEISPNDAIFFFSDGLPDQFGGPDGNKKFMTKKIKEIIEQNHYLPMNLLKNVFVNEFDNWKGDHKQMDDVLMIGIRF